MDQNRMPLVEALQQFREEAPAYFRIPGHRFERGLDETLNGASLAAYDLSEAEGLDDLHHAEGVIAEAQKLAAETWKAKKTFFLVNGTTCGNEAMVLSSVKEGEKIIVPRNVHKSVLMGLILSGATPVYVMPEYSTKWQMWGGVTPETIEKAFAETPDAKAVLLVSPTYYGLCSDLQAIAEICHCHNAALLVDEAHGSHLYFSEQLPLGALESGADACAQSIHKTAGSFTQSSFLSLGSGRLDEARVAANLQMVQSTSPSYLLMASLDAARRGMALHGKERMERALELGQRARQELAKIKGIEVLGTEMEGTCGVWKIDLTRLVFSARELGISGYDLQVRLYEEYRVSTELADEENVVVRYYLGKQRGRYHTADRCAGRNFGSRERENDGADEVYRKAVAVPQPAGDGKDTARGIFCGEGSRSVCRSGRANCSRDGSPISAGNPAHLPGRAVQQRNVGTDAPV